MECACGLGENAVVVSTPLSRRDRPTVSERASDSEDPVPFLILEQPCRLKEAVKFLIFLCVTHGKKIRSKTSSLM